MNRKIDVVEQLVMVLDRETRAHEDHDLLLPVLLEECEKKHQTFLTGTDDITLLQAGHGGGGAFLGRVIHPDVDRLLLQSHFNQIVRLFRGSGGEQHRLTLFCETMLGRKMSEIIETKLARATYQPRNKKVQLTGQESDDFLHFFLEADVQDSVRLVNDQGLQVLHHEVLGVLEVIQ